MFKLVKSLYGLKHASGQWNLKLTDALEEFGFVQSCLDYSLFIKRKDISTFIILVYVDDMLVSVIDLKLI